MHFKDEEASFVLSASQGSFRLKGKQSGRQTHLRDQVKWCQNRAPGTACFPTDDDREWNTPTPLRPASACGKLGSERSLPASTLDPWWAQGCLSLLAQAWVFQELPLLMFHQNVILEVVSQRCPPVPVQMFSETSTLHFKCYGGMLHWWLHKLAVPEHLK